MKRTYRAISFAVAVLGLVAVVIGSVFVFEGVAKNNLIVDRMKLENVTLALDPNNPSQGTLIQNAADAQKAADIIAQHRRSIAPTYVDLLGDGRFDPTNPTHLTYAQAMNLENYLYLAVSAFGLIQVTMAAGAFMIVAGIALMLIALLLLKIPAKAQEAERS